MTASFSDCQNGQIVFAFDSPDIPDDTLVNQRIASSALCQTIVDGPLTIAE